MTKPEPWEIFRFLSEKAKYLFIPENECGWVATDKEPVMSICGRYWSYSECTYYRIGSLITNFSGSWKDSVICRDDYAEKLGEKPTVSENAPVKKKIHFDSHEIISNFSNYKIFSQTSRQKVINGWLLTEIFEECESDRSFRNKVFIPDENHEWEID